MRKPLLLALSLMVVCTAFAGGKKDAAPIEQTPTAYFEGDGGNGKTITILPLKGNGIPADQDYLLITIELEFAANFRDYSKIFVFDRSNLEDIYAELYSGYYDDDSKELDLGHLPPTDYFMNGTITKTNSGYALQIQISNASDKMMTASYSEICTFDELDNFTGIRHASSELLGQLGVRLTEMGKQKLGSAADAKTVNSQTALAKANAAPTAFERMQYTYEAAAIDPSLKEAAQRLSAYQTAMFEIPTFTALAFTAPTFTLPAIQPVSTGNIGTDARDELARYRANKAAIEEQQQTLLRQRKEVFDQWQDFLRRINQQRQPLRDQEKALFQRQRELIALLREAEAFYAEHPPFRILYNPETERYGTIDYENATVDLRFRIVSEPTSMDALNDVLDALLNLNESFTTVNKAFEDVNVAMATRFRQVQDAMNAVKDALDKVNNVGKQYAVAAVSSASIEWNVTPGTNVYGAALTNTWPVDYPRAFSIAASLLNDVGAVIGRGEASLTNSISQGDPFKPEMALAWCEFKKVKIDDITDTLTVRIDTVNNRDTASAAVAGYIAITADRARIAAIERQIADQEAALAAQEAARVAALEYWATRLNSLGVAIGTAVVSTPAFLVSARLTFSPFANTFFELGSDFGLAHGEKDVQDVKYLSIAPYLHVNIFLKSDNLGLYIGIGAGASFSRYTYPSESHVEPVTVNKPTFDFNAGYLWIFDHSAIDLRWTVKTDFKGIDSRFTLGYIYRFGYFTTRSGGNSASLTGRR
ncbi:MAG: hypothetical protein LBD79_05955 [Treponema sp.]|jgi:hypothetical protein|nr:hypothetical protein [Treponema sp.]